MRVCYDEAAVREAAARGGHLLVDRFLENAIELDVDALCDGEETYVGAVMQHVEEAGVHSGDSSCVLPAPLEEPEHDLVVELVSRLGPALGVVGLLNVQLAIADGRLYVLEANPRASRTVPFVSKATGVNLVEAACRLAAGAKLSELAMPRGQSLGQVSVKAAVLPFARFPGADPVLGPERRRPSPPRTLRPRDQHAAGLRRADGRLPHPRGRARRPDSVRDDALGRRGGRGGNRARARRGRAQPAGEDRCSGAHCIAL